MSRTFLTLPVEGMTCASCVATVEKAVKSLEGIEEASANLALGNVSITYDPDKVDPQHLVQKIQEAGYRSSLASESKTKANESAREGEISLRQLGLIYLLALPVFVFGMFFHPFRPGQYISFVLTSLLLLIPARLLFIRAWNQVKHRAPAMDLLVALSTLTAYLLSAINLFSSSESTGHLWFETPAMLIAFVLTGRYLEGRARRQSTAAVNSLRRLQPETITVIRNGQPISIQAAEVVINDRVLVMPFELVPVDGIILKGETEIDESTITGEPLPIRKKKGDVVLAGTRNLEGMLTVLVTRPQGETLLDGIISSVARSLAAKAPVQQLADRIAGVFVPVVLVLAAVTWASWMIASGNPVQAFTFAITVLIIACPCALGLATPTALVAAAGTAARHGFLFRNGEIMEKAGLTTVAAFDKTGTLTTGEPTIKMHAGLDTLNSEDASIFMTMEKSSLHPLAHPVAEIIEKQANGRMLAEIQHEIQVIPGRGLSYTSASGINYRIQSLYTLKEENFQLNQDWASLATPMEEEGYTIIAGIKGTQLLWLMAAGDTLRKEARETVDMLHQRGIRTLLLTGDQPSAAKKMALQAGISEVYAGLLPAQKKNVIEALRTEGEKVLMVGDGINDAEALASADVSMAMARGNSLALDIAGITLIGNHLTSVARAIQLSRFTRSIIRQNLFWAFFYNVLCLPLAAGILQPITGFTLNPMIAGAAMSLSSVMVVTNSLRITRFNFKSKIKQWKSKS
ncbi:MAG: heavy metal translocating P-type ATPase [Bacteroidales bacterium]